ncbi:metal ABC transporter permease [Mastigocoleus testarum]|uniref:Uncharacterized protein n=1 Tax=Mastigocoleus testarum BC008 TaxID=371196 RepID=A0A0V7ZCX2_9CYAN|nr:metal ABC transporter permease [Mastigocoleus testarum]KST62376.1 hypothetical protein BC008_09400 [Mastigocoleus testarum BC008]
MKAVGVVLVISLLIGPGITAYLLVKELHHMMILGSLVGIIGGVMYYTLLATEMYRQAHQLYW